MIFSISVVSANDLNQTIETQSAELQAVDELNSFSEDIPDEILSANESTSKIPTKVKVSVKPEWDIDDLIKIHVYNLPKDIQGKVKIHINNKSYSTPFKNGKGDFYIKNLPRSNDNLVVAYGATWYVYHVLVEYKGNDIYNESQDESYFITYQPRPELKLYVENIMVGQTAKIVVETPPDAKGYVDIFLEGKNGIKTYTVKIVNGKAVLFLKNLIKGNYYVSVGYMGDEKYYWTYGPGDSFNVSDYEPYLVKKVSKTLKNNYTFHRAGNPIIILLISLSALVLFSFPDKRK